VKKRPCKRTALSIGSLLGNLEEVLLLGLLRDKKRMHIWFPFSLDPEDMSGCHLEL